MPDGLANHFEEAYHEYGLAARQSRHADAEELIGVMYAIGIPRRAGLQACL